MFIIGNALGENQLARGKHYGRQLSRLSIFFGVIVAAFLWRLPVIWVYFIIASDEIIKLPWVFAHYKRYLWVKNITKENI